MPEATKSSEKSTFSEKSFPRRIYFLPNSTSKFFFEESVKMHGIKTPADFANSSEKKSEKNNKFSEKCTLHLRGLITTVFQRSQNQAE